MFKSMFDSGRYLKYIFIIVAVLIAIVSVVVSNSLIEKLAQEERLKMEIWSEAIRVLSMDNSTTGDSDDSNMDISLILHILDGNTTIPVILCEDDGQIVDFRNIEIAEKEDQNAFLQKKIKEFESRKTPILIELGDTNQYVFYDDSLILKRLEIFPYAQLSVVFIFIMIAFLALMSTKKAEQNRDRKSVV